MTPGTPTVSDGGAVTADRLGYMRNEDIRREIAGIVGFDQNRYMGGKNRGFKLVHMRAIGEVMGIENADELMLSELFSLTCREAGVSYNANAGCQWGLGRIQLKAILRELGGVVDAP